MSEGPTLRDMSSYGDDISKLGGVIVDALTPTLSKSRRVIAESGGQLLADNALLHGLYMLLSHHLSFIILNASGDVMNEAQKEEVCRAVQHSIGITMKKLMGDLIKAGDAKIIFLENNPKGKEGETP